MNKMKKLYFTLIICHYIKRFKFYNKINNITTDFVKLFTSEFIFYIENKSF